ncbi:MAG: ShlB/FhaC/HecB family hemolysin secretion/activation protein, partial [Spirulinaceae cyanobacterium RM2_2_10]|nr:ShlB/FhaC/HecB family hemolysin secretion/activation protein [Spirulinaceae cyanobacterium RM2_2_10]
VTVDRLEVRGSTAFAAGEFEPFLAEFQGKTVTIRELQAVADRITEEYLEAGYITSRAQLLPESLATGNVIIEVLEGRVSKITIAGTQRLRESYVRDRVAIGLGIPLNSADLEDQLRLLRQNPLFENIEASLIPGSAHTPDASELLVRVVEAKATGGQFSLDNQSPPSIGSERASLDLFHRNLTERGDFLSASYRRTLAGGADTGEVSYHLPLNAREGTLRWRSYWQQNQAVQEPFAALEIGGASQLHELSFRQPLWRNPRQEFALSLGFTYQTGQTFTFAGPTPFGIGPDAEGETTTSVVKFEQDYLRRDQQGAWAGRSQFSFGTGLFDATTNPGAIPDGQFFSWLGQVQRVQLLGANHLLVLSADLQWASGGLLSSQQFVIGGAQSVRGYRQNARVGDNGARLSLEHRWTLDRNDAGQPTFQLLPFADVGWVWNDPENPNLVAEPHLLAGVGLGLVWRPLDGWRLRLDYGLPLVATEDRGTNAQDRGFYFDLEYEF